VITTRLEANWGVILHPLSRATNRKGFNVELHYEIKCRAYELYERRHDAADSHDLKAELRRVAYAAVQLQKYSNGEVGDTRAVKAAQVYLRALSAFISERNWIDQDATTPSRDIEHGLGGRLDRRHGFREREQR